MKVRSWATPLTSGSFILMAVTGTLMFFKIRIGQVTVAHEFFSLLFVLGCIFHIVANWNPMRQYLTRGKSRLVIIGFVVLTVVALLPLVPQEKNRGNSMYKASAVLLNAPLPTVASLTGQDIDKLVANLEAKGIPANTQETIHEMASKAHLEPWTVLGIALEGYTPAMGRD